MLQRTSTGKSLGTTARTTRTSRILSLRTALRPIMRRWGRRIIPWGGRATSPPLPSSLPSSLDGFMTFMTVVDPDGTYVFLRRVLQKNLRWEQKRENLFLVSPKKVRGACPEIEWRWRYGSADGAIDLGVGTDLMKVLPEYFWHWGKLTLLLAYLSQPLISGHTTN